MSASAAAVQPRNLLLPTPGVCGRCPTWDGECPLCGTLWRGGIGFRLEWAPGGADLFLKEARALAEQAGLPAGAIQIVQLKP